MLDERVLTVLARLEAGGSDVSDEGGSEGGSSLSPRLNSLIPFPIDAPISGIRLAPKKSTTMSSRIAISVNPRLPSMVRLS